MQNIFKFLKHLYDVDGIKAENNSFQCNVEGCEWTDEEFMNIVKESFVKGYIDGPKELGPDMIFFPPNTWVTITAKGVDYLHRQNSVK